LFIYKMLWSAFHQPIGQGTNCPSNYLLAGQDFVYTTISMKSCDFMLCRSRDPKYHKEQLSKFTL